MITTVIIEDEVHSREFLKNLIIELHPDLRVTGTASDVSEGIRLINSNKPGIIFLDIELHTGTGFDILRQIDTYDCNIIFTTAYDHYAIKAIKFSAVDYLLKPIDIEELNDAIDKVRRKSNQTAQPSAIDVLLANLKNIKTENLTITLSTSDGLEFIPVKNIVRLEALGAYTTFFLIDGRKVLVSKNLKEYENLLEGYSFMRVHNSHVINLRQVKKLIKTDGGHIVMSDNTNVLLSPKKKDEFLKFMASINT